MNEQKDKILAELYGMIFKVGGREMFEQGIRKVITMIEEEKDWETAYHAGFEYGYQTAVKDVIKRLRGMKTYGGNNKAQRAAEVPEGTGRNQKAVQREI